MSRTGFHALLLLLSVLQSGCLSPPDAPVAPPPVPVAYPSGPAATGALAAWGALLHSARELPEAGKLDAVNAFFNRLDFRPDRELRKAEDYWATPRETLLAAGGDCEDFAIAKYYTLRQLGVPEERLRLTYTIARRPARAHMVLAYYSGPEADPLILDSLAQDLRYGSQRADLMPVFAFNAQTLWVEGKRQAARDTPMQRIANWRELSRRMATEIAYAAL
jgi:predicted transglutaminase-like cysteine proteinase